MAVADAIKLAVADAIHELFQSELKHMVDKDSEQSQQIEELQKAVQDLSGSAADKEQLRTQWQESFASLRQEIEESNAKFQALVNEDIATLKARVDKCEDDPDGVGGLKQVFATLQRLEKTSGDAQTTNEAVSKLTKENNSRVDEMDRRVRELSRQTDDLGAKVAAAETKTASADNGVAMIKKAQEALEDSVARKYERLWEDILRAMDETKAAQLEVMKNEMESKQKASGSETSTMVKYALDFMAKATGERRQMQITKTLVTAWKEQTWMTARRNMGISKLHRLTMIRQRSAFNRFVVTTVTEARTSQLCDRLRSQYDDQLSEVVKTTVETTDKLGQSLKEVSDQVGTLRLEKDSIEGVDKKLLQLRNAIELELKAIPPIDSKLQEHEKSITRFAEEHRAHRDAEGALGKQLAETSLSLQNLTELAATFAKSEEVNNMVRDILMIWNSLKSIDATKADREYVDNFAMLSRDKDKLSSRRLEDLEADLAAKSRQDVLRVQEKMSEVDTRIDENTRNMRHWEQMWEKLSGLVEDLVTKINDLQGQGPGKLPDTVRLVTRMGSKRTLSRAEIPTIPRTADSGEAATPKNHGGVYSQVHVDGADSKMLWINGAKGIVDATIDQAIQSTDPLSSRTPLSARKLARPKSATIRRQLDRGM